MRSRLLTFLATLLLAACPARAEVPVQNNLTWNGECSLVADPGDPSHLVVAWMKLTAAAQVSIAVSVSTDHGHTWSAPAHLPHANSLWTSADPTLAFGPDGSVYLAYVDFEAPAIGPGGGVDLVSRSVDGGHTWGPVSTAISSTATPDRPVDRPWLAVDRTAGPLGGRVYLECKSVVDTTTIRHVWMVSSGDQGATWSAPHRVDLPVDAGPGVGSMGVPAVAADGALWVMYVSYDPALFPAPRFIAAVSRDTAVTFQSHTVASMTAPSVAPDDTLYKADYHLAAHPTDPRTLVAVWTASPDTGPDIYLSRTTNGGLTWSAPRRLNDDPAKTGVGQDMVTGAFGATGSYAAAWRDRRPGGAGDTARFDVYAAFSADGGAGFFPNVRVSTLTSPAIGYPAGVDFLGVAVGDTLVHAAWTSAVGTHYSLHAGSVSVAPFLVGVKQPSPREGPLRVLGTSHGVIRLALGRPCGPLDRFQVRDVAGREWPVKTERTAEGAALRFSRRPASGIYLIEWRSARGRFAAKALVIH